MTSNDPEEDEKRRTSILGVERPQPLSSARAEWSKAGEIEHLLHPL